MLNILILKQFAWKKKPDDRILSHLCIKLCIIIENVINKLIALTAPRLLLECSRCFLAQAWSLRGNKSYIPAHLASKLIIANFRSWVHLILGPHNLRYYSLFTVRFYLTMEF